jgi:hypothetical protein
MKTSMQRWNGALAGVCLVAGLAGCVSAPQGPRVAVMPTPGKPLDLFAAEDQYCRGYAQQSLGPDTRGEAAVGAAVLGTLLGAAVGAATSSRRYNNTASAATGLVAGSSHRCRAVRRRGAAPSSAMTSPTSSAWSPRTTSPHGSITANR